MIVDNYVRVLDFLTFLSLYLALIFSYQPRFSRVKTALFTVGFCFLGVAGTLIEEQMEPYNFLFYAINYMLWGGLYSAFVLKGQLGLKMAMTAVFCASVFYSFDFAHVLGVVTGINRWRYFSLIFIGLAALFLNKTALHSQRKIPSRVWGTIVAASMLGIVSYTMRYKPSIQMGVAEFDRFIFKSAVGNLCHLLILYILFFTVSLLIRRYEYGMAQLSLHSGEEEQTIMSDEIKRLNERMRLFQHEKNHQFNAIDALLAQGKNDQARSLINEIAANTPVREKGIRSGNAVADAILNRFSAAAAEKGIAFRADVALDTGLPISDIDLVSLLSNLLSNALQGSSAVNEPKIMVRIFPVRSYLCIEVKNRADTAALRSNPEMHSTKEDPEYHGFGLSVIRDIASSYEGMADFSITDDGWFVAKVSLLMDEE